MVSLIFAISENDVIGLRGDLPWKVSSDLKHFAVLTKGHTVLMGRKTHESIVNRLGKPLPGRKSVVITRQLDYMYEGATIYHSLQEALDKERSDNKLFIIGGAELYRDSINYVQKMYVTLVHCNVEGDTFFPEWKTLTQAGSWKQISSTTHQPSDTDQFSFTFLEYQKV